MPQHSKVTQLQKALDVKEGLWNVLVNASVVFASLAILLMVFEFVIFRFVLLPTELPRNTFINGLVRYAPNQSGTYRVRNSVQARFSINRQGWNSGHEEYRIERAPGSRRVLIIGDSYVEALQVDASASLAEQLERLLVATPTEVYRMGIMSAPLSHYLHMLEREGVNYRPDVVVVVLVHNDFDESFYPFFSRYTSNLMRVRLENGHAVQEILPAPFEPRSYDWLRFSRTARYLYYRQKLGQSWYTWFRTVQKFQANVEVNTVLGEWANIQSVTDYLFGRLASVARVHQACLLLLMDGDRQAIYRGVDTAGLYQDGALRLNKMAAEIAKQHDIRFIDLHPRFEQDWHINQQRFEFPDDGHWNEHGHAVAAQAVSEFISHGSCSNDNS